MGLRLQEVYDMPWNEFVIKSQGFARVQKRKNEEVRILAYHSYISGNVRLKTIPKFESFMNKGGSGKDSEAMQKGLERLEKMQQEFISKQSG